MVGYIVYLVYPGICMCIIVYTSQVAWSVWHGVHSCLPHPPPCAVLLYPRTFAFYLLKKCTISGQQFVYTAVGLACTAAVF